MQKYWLFLDTIMLLDDATVSDYCVGRRAWVAALRGTQSVPTPRDYYKGCVTWLRSFSPGGY